MIGTNPGAPPWSPPSTEEEMAKNYMGNAISAIQAPAPPSSLNRIELPPPTTKGRKEGEVLNKTQKTKTKT